MCGLKWSLAKIVHVYGNTMEIREETPWNVEVEIGRGRAEHTLHNGLQVKKALNKNCFVCSLLPILVVVALF